MTDLKKYIETLKLAAAGRKEYAETCDHADWKQFMLGQAAAYESAARMLETDNWMHLIAAQVPSWSWPKEIDNWVMGRTEVR